jgi:hypothetical protein
MNFATVSEIVEEPRFVAWLEAAGFTREEIALVQPTYCGVKPLDCICENLANGGATVALVSYRSNAEDYTVTEIHRAAPGVEVGAKVRTQVGTPPQSGVDYIDWVYVPSEGSWPEKSSRCATAQRVPISSMNVGRRSPGECVLSGKTPGAA